MAEVVAGPGTGTGHRSLQQLAGLVGGYRWIELRLYEILGGWVATMALPGVQVVLDAESTRHAWRAERLAGHLPVLAHVDAAALTRPLGDADRSVLGALASTVDGGPGALPLLAGLYRVVLPRLLGAYRRHEETASPLSERPVARTLRLFLAEGLEDWRAGESLVERLVARPHDVDAVHSFERHLESLAVASEGILGRDVGGS